MPREPENRVSLSFCERSPLMIGPSVLGLPGASWVTIDRVAELADFLMNMRSKQMTSSCACAVFLRRKIFHLTSSVVKSYHESKHSMQTKSCNWISQNDLQTEKAIL